jgi:hypothetical protein
MYSQYVQPPCMLSALHTKPTHALVNAAHAHAIASNCFCAHCAANERHSADAAKALVGKRPRECMFQGHVAAASNRQETQSNKAYSMPLLQCMVENGLNR